MPTNSDFQVVVGAFANEAAKWDELADKTLVLKDRTAELNLWPSAFFCGNIATAAALSGAYDDVYALMRTLLTDAAAEFDEIAGALRIAAKLYDGTDQQSASTLVAIYGKGYKE
jgi:hypothetical protein